MHSGALQKRWPDRRRDHLCIFQIALAGSLLELEQILDELNAAITPEWQKQRL